MPFDQYDLTIDVSIEDVQTAFGEADGTSFSDDTIQQKINEEELIVASQLPDDLDDLKIPEDTWEDGIEMLIRRRVARSTWHSAPTAVRKQALDLTISYDIQGFRGNLNNDVEEAYAILGVEPDGGESAAFVEATGSVLDGGC